MSILNWIKSFFGKKVEKPWYSEIVELYPENTPYIGKQKEPWLMCVNNGDLTPKDILTLVDYPHLQFRPCSSAIKVGKNKYDYDFRLSGNEDKDYILSSMLYKGARFYKIGRIH